MKKIENKNKNALKQTVENTNIQLKEAVNKKTSPKTKKEQDENKKRIKIESGSLINKLK